MGVHNTNNYLFSCVRIFNSIDDSAVDLICSMMAMDPAKRLSADECLAHAFFSQEPLISSN